MKIVILGTRARYQRYLPDLPFARAQTPVYLDKDSSEEQILAAAGDAEVMLVDAIAPVSGRLIEAMPHLRLIHSEGVAFDKIDLSAPGPGELMSATARDATPPPWQSRPFC